ncbi:centrosomal AT-AC splicing factor [Pseudophryne corroboree]|uniref:centrosomal AT-AC splicing factor n=1 Tax=Pseudophryne corroboree TaxID=495146 RepID=UPI003081EAA3
MVAFLCAVCRKTVFCGRRKHAYGKAHREQLALVLRSFSDKVTPARKMIKGATIVRFDPQEHERKFWCHCCEEEVQRHTSDGSLTVLYGGMLEHLHRPSHIKAVNKFWWTHQADGKLKAHFVITEDEFGMFKSSVTKALESYEETEDVLIQQVAGQIREVEQTRLDLLQTVLEPVTQPTGEEEEPWSSTEREPFGMTPGLDMENAGPSNGQTLPRANQPVGSDPLLTFIGHQVMSNNGNIHTGALPPWMVPDEEVTETQRGIGPSLEDFLKHKEKMKLKKLPPNRVGANFDHSAPTDEGWLPSFGRVWNSGRRWQSRHQYRSEAGDSGAKRRKTENKM